MLDIRQLTVFHAVVRAGSFAGAARELGCSPQAVAQAVQRLETGAGVQLVVRGRDGVTLTGAGRDLARRAARVAAELHRAEEELEDSAAGRHRSVRVGSLRSAWRNTELAEVFTAATGVAMTVSVVDTSAGLRDLRAGRVDALLGYDLDLLTLHRSGELRFVDLVREPSWLACSPAHEAARSAEVDLADLHDAVWLAQPPGTLLHRYLLAVCRSAGFEPRVRFTADSWDLLEPLYRNVGVTLCSPIVVPDDKVVVRPLRPPVGRMLFAAWRPGHPAAADLERLPALARRLYLDHVAGIPAYARWLEDHPESLPPLPG